jgi:hypothetical protein
MIRATPSCSKPLLFWPMPVLIDELSKLWCVIKKLNTNNKPGSKRQRNSYLLLPNSTRLGKRDISLWHGVSIPLFSTYLVRMNFAALSYASWRICRGGMKVMSKDRVMKRRAYFETFLFDCSNTSADSTGAAYISQYLDWAWLGRDLLSASHAVDRPEGLNWGYWFNWQWPFGEYTHGLDQHNRVDLTCMVLLYAQQITSSIYSISWTKHQSSASESSDRLLRIL